MAARTIAVVEDEGVIADAVAARLRGEGFEVGVAADGEGAVELCRRLQPDAVVLDLMLPGLDGLEVCRRIQRDRAVPVLMRGNSCCGRCGATATGPARAPWTRTSVACGESSGPTSSAPCAERATR